ncbi:MAG: acyl-CoA thioesterase [Cyanobacteria bacterium QS_8_64_29]|nr:MAG: acyl-CoA thioesterase [Cyanobacteria bacterium QS_8_64_29]
MPPSPPSDRLPTDAPQPEGELQAYAQAWFDYPIRVHPHHTDYAGVVWHGNYLTWMEEARIECLRSMGIDYSHLAALGYDLPVVELALRYHQVLRMGEAATVKTRLAQRTGARIIWDYRIQAPEGDPTYVTGQVTLVALDRERGKILRQLPAVVQEALAQRAP